MSSLEFLGGFLLVVETHATEELTEGAKYEGLVVGWLINWRSEAVFRESIE